MRRKLERKRSSQGKELETWQADNTCPVYFFIGCVLLGGKWYNYVPASITALIGLVYIALEFVPSIEPPANMRYV